MTSPARAVAAAAACGVLAGCGGSPPDAPEELRPIATFAGNYRLDVVASSVCTEVAVRSMGWDLVATQAADGGVLMTLRGGNAAVELGLRAEGRVVGGSLYVAPQLIPNDREEHEVVVEATLAGSVTARPDGRGVVEGGSWSGRLTVSGPFGAGPYRICAAADHAWSLRPL